GCRRSGSGQAALATGRPARCARTRPGWVESGNALRGYFGVGVEGVSKPMNLGNLVRIAHAFEASFFFSIAPRLKLSDANSDTSNAEGVLPFYSFAHPDDFRLPLGCRLVGVEITDDAIELPRFRHPTRAAYVFGAE